MKRILPQAPLLSRSSVNAFLLHERRGKELCDKQKDINGDNSPTVPQEKRVVPLLMVWMSRCGGGKIGADSQNKQKKWGTKVHDVCAQTTIK